MGYAYNTVDDTAASQEPAGLARFLCGPGEEGAPPATLSALTFLENLGVWYMLSRNSAATSCRDAASRRRRLGYQGIPLADELKTGAYVWYGKDGARRFVFLHSRADRRFDFARAEAILDAGRPLARMAPDELANRFGASYGTVNPFFTPPSGCLHIFDTSLLEPGLPPHTMMTNAGDHTWALEFPPAELARTLVRDMPEAFRIERVCEQAANVSGERPAFGIITGNGPDSGQALWRNLNAAVQERLGDRLFRGDLSYPPVNILSIPEMGLSMELEPREEETWKHLSRGVRILCEQGAGHIALACHTTHYFTEPIRRICHAYGARFVSMTETVVDYVTRHGITEASILGIPYVADLGRWSAYRDLSAISIRPLGGKARNALLEFGYFIKSMGNDANKLNKGLNLLNNILKASECAPHVIIALTEISVLLEKFPKKQHKIGEYHIIDPLRLYGERLADIHVARILSEDDDQEVEPPLDQEPAAVFA